MGAYTPQTEAISPTLPEPNTQEDAQFKSTKDDLLQQIAKVDREIAKRESQLNMLRKRTKELEETASKPLEAGLKRNVEEQSQPKHQSMAQKIYAENRVNYIRMKLNLNAKMFYVFFAFNVFNIFIYVLSKY